MSFARIAHIITRRIVIAIKVIVVYEAKISMAHDSMNQDVRQGAKVSKNANNKRRRGSKKKSNHVQQPPSKRQNVARAYIVGSNEKKAYAGNFPHSNKCKLHHAGPCSVRCGKCKRVCHMNGNCKAFVVAMNQRASMANQKADVNCYECGKQGHYKRECLKLKNQNYGD
nr:reverse transcriptase domain-containing protein [Tanacetum cinerariifolium]